MPSTCIVTSLEESWHLFEEWYHNTCPGADRFLTAHEVHYLLHTYFVRTGNHLVQFYGPDDVMFFIMNELMSPRLGVPARFSERGNRSKTKNGINMIVSKLYELLMQ